ncbi:hypothetical protein [uncultured Bifidobacterium sp.]|uniref:Lactococcin 972 family bacteriocin n=2 Tax=Bifidobacterium TaxID=1678 RepID=A0A7V8HP78_9BIFI|nr:hypothetical protein [uncultured Bifidobacterium sp.]KFI80872.1 hypothetical protein BPULL_0405 [Bifidobacterium pullorum]
MTRKTSSIIASVACCVMLCLSSQTASAEEYYYTGERNDSQYTAFYGYNWTHSYASCQSRASRCTVEAWQDGHAHKKATVQGMNQLIKVEDWGDIKNVNDGAKFY